MSYARWSNSDIYAYPHVEGGYICQWCSLAEPRMGKFIWEDSPVHPVPGDFRCQTLVELRSHVLEHIAVGDNVGDSLEYIDAEIAEGCPYD